MTSCSARLCNCQSVHKCRQFLPAASQGWGKVLMLVCLPVHTGAGVPSFSLTGAPPSSLMVGGHPHQTWWGYSHSTWQGVPHLVQGGWDTLAMSVWDTPCWDQMEVPPCWTGWGYPPHRDWMGVCPIGMDGGTLPPSAWIDTPSQAGWR